MIAHVVLFRPKATLDADQRGAFVAALEYALTQIPQIARARVGRRLSLGRAYDALNLQSYPFAAILEFDTEADLLAYLEHPAHEALGAQFYTTAESALAFDYEWLDRDRIRELL